MSEEKLKLERKWLDLLKQNEEIAQKQKEILDQKEKKLNEKWDKERSKYRVPVQDIDEIIHMLDSDYFKVKEELENINSYSGPDPSHGRHALVLETKRDLLNEIIGQLNQVVPRKKLGGLG